MSGRDEFLARRRMGIGGSDAAGVLGLSPYETPLDVYREKRGEAPEREQTAAMEWGTLIEPAIVEAYRRKTGFEVRTGPAVQHLVSARHPFMRCNLDGLVHNGDVNAPGIIVEAKLSSIEDQWGEPGTDQVPAHFIPQAQHMMAVTGFEVVEFAVLFVRFGVKALEVYPVPRDNELIEMLTERERVFWQRVVDGNPPDPTTPEDIRLRWPKDNGTSIEADDTVVAALDLFVQAKDEARVAKAKTEEFAGVVQRYMGEASILTYKGATLATWKQAKPALVINTERLTAGHPDIAAQYTESKPGSRRFLPKG